MSHKHLVLEVYPLARCVRFPMILPTPLTITWRVHLTPKGEIFSKGNTSGQAWRRAYEKILQQQRAADGIAAG